MRDWHSMFGGREWRVHEHGVASRGDGASVAVHRTGGDPRTMRLYAALLGEEIRAASLATGVPAPLLLMTLGTENGPADVDNSQLNIIPVRREPGYQSDEGTPHRISVGPCHVLISTARAAMGDDRIDRAWLLNPGNNILAAARYIASQRKATGYDPILVAAAYNAGRLADASSPSSRYHNRWHLRSYGNHLDRAAAWVGDAIAVIRELDQWEAVTNRVPEPWRAAS